MYNYENELAGFSKYHSDGALPGIKSLYNDNFLSFHRNIKENWESNKSVSLDNIVKGFCLISNWEALMLVDFMQKELKIIELIHTSSSASNYNIYIPTDEFFEPTIDLYDFVELFKKLIPSENFK